MAAFFSTCPYCGKRVRLARCPRQATIRTLDVEPHPLGTMALNPDGTCRGLSGQQLVLARQMGDALHRNHFPICHARHRGLFRGREVARGAAR